MCGIAGLISREPTDVRVLDEMLRRLEHRGPDDHGWLVARDREWESGRGPVPRAPAAVALGHRRLAIIDLSPAGWQPMTSPDRRLALALNGEIYNFMELRDELEATGWRFRSSSDTEVFLAGWAAWGQKILDRVVGMFAFCMVDFDEGVAYLARDPFGIKPLFLAERGPSLAFASEINALLAVPDVDRAVEPATLYDYLRFGTVDHTNRTMFASITRVSAGELIEVDLADPLARTASRYWRLPDRGGEPMSFDDAASAVRKGFEESVRLHLRSDVPIGFALSGGIDSSALAVTARHLLGPDPELHAFSYLADDPRLDESKWVDLAAEAAKVRVHPVRLEATSLRTALADLIASQGEPFAGTSIVAQRCVFAAAREAGVPVLLDGQGADELFGGYRSHLAGRFATLLRSGDLPGAARLARSVVALPNAPMTPRTTLRVAAGVAPRWLKPLLLRGAGLEPFPGWMNQTWFKDRGVWGGIVGREPASGGLADAFSTTSLPSLLRYEDRNSMRFSVESRVPFLERNLVELVFGLPEEYIFGADATTKKVFRAAMRGKVPDSILDRRDKIGFATPECEWLTTEHAWVQEIILRAAGMPWFDSTVSRIGAERTMPDHVYHDHTLWRWLNVILWVEATGATW